MRFSILAMVRDISTQGDVHLLELLVFHSQHVELVLGFLKTFFVLMLQFHKIFDQVFDLLVLFAVHLTQVVNSAFFFFEVVSDTRVLILIWFELILERLVFNRQLIDVSFDLSDFAVDFTIPALVISYSFMYAFEFKACFVILLIKFLVFAKELVIFLHEVQALFAKFFDFYIFTIEGALEGVFLFFNLCEFGMVVFELVF